jgi:DNA-binding transcriptional LysR family regulator
MMMMMKLEEELNQKLFTRSQKGVQLTANGQVIFDSL